MVVAGSTGCVRPVKWWASSSKRCGRDSPMASVSRRHCMVGVPLFLALALLVATPFFVFVWSPNHFRPVKMLAKDTGAAVPRSVPMLSGHQIPTLGLGTWRAGEPTPLLAALTHALHIGWRHIDGAAMYANEAVVGAAVKASGVDRKSVV